MSLINKIRKQTGSYWERTGLDEFSNPTFESPVSITCRWETKMVQYLNPKGELVFSQSVVYVDRQMQVGDWVCLGTTGESDPRNQDGAHEIKGTESIPDLKARQTLHKVFL